MQPAAYGDVSVRPIPPKPSLFPDHEEPMNLQEAAPPASFIPQQAERMPMRAPRMPQFEELPVPAQNQIRQARVKPPKNIRRRSVPRCCSVWPMSALAAATRIRAADRSARLGASHGADASAARAQAAASGSRRVRWLRRAGI
jgi:hypothetical protein